MFCMHRIKVLLFLCISIVCFCIGIAMVHFCINNKFKKYSEGIKAMTNWLDYLREDVDASGQFVSKDKRGNPVDIKWYKRDAQSLDFSQLMRQIAQPTAESFASVETTFLRAYPDLVFKEKYFESFQPFFKAGVEKVDWERVEAKMKDYIKSFHEADFSQLSKDDIYFFVMVTNKETEEMVGLAVFFVTPLYREGDIKVINIAVRPQDRSRGLGKLLMSSILKIVPKIRRIFLMTRVTNDTAINAYLRWGFTKDPNPIQHPGHPFDPEHWISLEYKVDASDTVQKMAEKLSE